MNSQLRFVMHPADEREFAAQVLADPAVLLIDGPRWQAAAPQTFRDLDAIRGNYCILWSPDDQAALQARYIAGCNDWYCESEYATVQFLRSEIFADGVLFEGRIAVATGSASAQAAQESSGATKRWAASCASTTATPCCAGATPPCPSARPCQGARPTPASRTLRSGWARMRCNVCAMVVSSSSAASSSRATRWWRRGWLTASLRLPDNRAFGPELQGRVRAGTRVSSAPGT